MLINVIVWHLENYFFTVVLFYCSQYIIGYILVIGSLVIVHMIKEIRQVVDFLK